jgi:hypothetical protein
MRLHEIFNTKFAAKVSSDPYGYTRTVTLGQDIIEVNFEITDPHTKQTTDYYIKNHSMIPGELSYSELRDYFNKKIPIPIVIKFEVNGKTEMKDQTNGRLSSKTSMSVVINQINTFLAAHPVCEILFTAKTSETSRVDLYDRLVRKLTGFHLLAKTNIGKYTHYIIIKDQL